MTRLRKELSSSIIIFVLSHQLYNQVEGELDFAKEVSKISGSVDLQLEKAAETPEEEDVGDLEGSADPEIQEEGVVEKGSKVSDVRNSLNEDGTLLANALDLRLGAVLENFLRKLQIIFIYHSEKAFKQHRKASLSFRRVGKHRKLKMFSVI